MKREWTETNWFLIVLWFLLIGNAFFFLFNGISITFLLEEVPWRGYFAVAINFLGTVGCIYSLRITYRQRRESINDERC